MLTAKLFENGRSQAVRLPKECRFEGDEVMINKVGDVVFLIPKDNGYVYRWFHERRTHAARSTGTRKFLMKRGFYEIHVGYEYLHICNKK